jgi:hypothetical protein
LALAISGANLFFVDRARHSSLGLVGDFQQARSLGLVWFIER